MSSAQISPQLLGHEHASVTHSSTNTTSSSGGHGALDHKTVLYFGQNKYHVHFDDYVGHSQPSPKEQLSSSSSNIQDNSDESQGQVQHSITISSEESSENEVLKQHLKVSIIKNALMKQHVHDMSESLSEDFLNTSQRIKTAHEETRR